MDEQEHRHIPAQQRGLMVSKATQDTAQGMHRSQSLCLDKQPGVGYTCVTPSAQDAPRGRPDGHVLKTANAGLSWVAQGGRSLEQPCLPSSSQHNLNKVRRPSKFI